MNKNIENSIMKNFPRYDKTVEEIYNEVVDEVDRRIGWRLVEARGIKCVNFARKYDDTLCPPGVLIIQCRDRQNRDWWWSMLHDKLTTPLRVFERDVWLETAKSGIRPSTNWERILRSPRLDCVSG